MPMDSRQYRDHLHKERAHPGSPTSLNKDSFRSLYLSLIPCLGFEYYCELRFETLPSGIIFPAAYLLFWAFYYTYYKPGHLESKLVSGERWDLFSIPTVLMGTVIWFVKVVVVEFVELVIFRKIFQKRPQASYEKNFHRVETPPVQPKADPNALPRDISNALAILGVKDCRDWTVIQKRYRDLAKQYHPDLNPDITIAGNRFIIYDGAYRKLSAVKNRYFFEKSANG